MAPGVHNPTAATPEIARAEYAANGYALSGAGYQNLTAMTLAVPAGMGPFKLRFGGNIDFHTFGTNGQFLLGLRIVDEALATVADLYLGCFMSATLKDDYRPVVFESKLILGTTAAKTYMMQWANVASANMTCTLLGADSGAVTPWFEAVPQ